MSLEQQLQELEQTYTARLQTVDSLTQVEEIRQALLGQGKNKGELTTLLRGMGSVPAEDRPRVGSLINQTSERLKALLATCDADLKRVARDAALAAETLDVTLPAPPLRFGRRHPLMATWNDIVRIFSNLGFSVAEGPEVETSYYNFDALNIGPDHPARAERDSLFVDDDLVLRTETSAVQIRVMEGQEPPVRIIAPGRVYRRDAVDATHSAVFHQVEGLCVAEGITFGDLKGTLTAFLTQLFEAAPSSTALQTRFRPHHFPFTEPSAEFDVFFNGKWLELGGCGMVHPRVLENVGYDSERYTGFAFGFGIERMAMIQFDIKDIRHFYDNDLRFLEQF